MDVKTGGKKMRRVAIIICLIVVPILSLAQTTNIRDRDGRLEYTGNRNGNDYQIRDRSGRLKWTEQAED